MRQYISPDWAKRSVLTLYRMMEIAPLEHFGEYLQYQAKQ
jgi:hypothetical protein